jgi:hypothetical protein
MTQTAEITKQQRHKERRAQLRELSKIAKMRLSADCEGMTVNEVLIMMYKDSENKEFKTLHQWNADGYKVNKGSESFLVWGKPKPMTKEAQSSQKQAEEDDESEFYPLCYLFSNAQVTKR